MKKTVLLLLCVCLLLTGVLPALAAGEQDARCASLDAGASPARTALLLLEDWLFALNERLRETLRGMDLLPQEEPSFPRAKVTAKTLWLMDRPVGDAALLLGSLQGVLANAGETQLLFRDGAYRQYLEYTDAEIVEKSGPETQPEALLNAFADVLNGYVLCDEAGAQAAVSVAGVLQAVVVPESLQSAAEAADLTMLEDVRGWSDLTLRRSRYFSQLSRTVAFSQPVSYAPKLVDYAVMAGAYFGFCDSDNQLALRGQYAFLRDNAVVFGWNSVLGEYGTVKALSSLNACLIPADHACNLSVLSGFPSVDLKQATADESASVESPHHTVCLFMSDGDNLQWILSSYNTATHFASPLRGKFPMGWGLPASLNAAAPAMASWLYANAAPGDEFIMMLSGLGYTFPSHWTNPFALRRMDRALSEQMAKADLHIAAVLDDGGFSHRALDVLAGQESVSGVFWLDYSDYAGMKGSERLSHGKPIVSAKYKLWYDHPGGSPEEIAAAVNAASRDPSDPDAYSLIVIHAWSGLDSEGNFSGSGDAMAAVDKMVAAFDDDVRVVTPSAFSAALADALS
jgi:hypothetical protein